MKIPIHQYNLDLPPLERWRFLTNYRSRVKRLEHKIFSNPTIFLSWSEKLISEITKHVVSRFAAYVDDLRAISQILDIHLGRLILMQLVYESCSCCTSLIFKDSDDHLHHFRTMDWEMPDLKRMTLQLEVFRNGQLLYYSTTWVGYLGCLTVMRPNNYTIAVNYRRTPTTSDQPNIWTNFRNLVSYYWPVGYVVKHTIENYSDLYQAKDYLEKALLISPTYFTICGKYDGFLITRKYNGLALPTLRLINMKERYLVQTNIDWSNQDPRDNILWSLERQKYVRDNLSQIHGQSFDPDRIWEFASKWPILNDDTIYATLMSPTNNTYQNKLATLNIHNQLHYLK